MDNWLWGLSLIVLTIAIHATKRDVHGSRTTQLPGPAGTSGPPRAARISDRHRHYNRDGIAASRATYHGDGALGSRLRVAWRIRLTTSCGSLLR